MAGRGAVGGAVMVAAAELSQHAPPSQADPRMRENLWLRDEWEAGNASHHSTPTVGPFAPTSGVWLPLSGFLSGVWHFRTTPLSSTPLSSPLSAP
jgi:hypothetical protein